MDLSLSLSLSIYIYIYISIYKEANFVAQNIVNWALLCNPDPRFLFGELGARWSVFPFFVIVSLFNEKYYLGMKAKTL